jgi:hypothetical protein
MGAPWVMRELAHVLGRPDGRAGDQRRRAGSGSARLLPAGAAGPPARCVASRCCRGGARARSAPWPPGASRRSRGRAVRHAACRWSSLVALLPAAAARDEQGPHADPAKPGAHHLGGAFAAVVRPDVVGRAALDEEVGQPRSPSSEVRLRATARARPSRVSASITVSMRQGRPSCLRPCTKS